MLLDWLRRLHTLVALPGWTLVLWLALRWWGAHLPWFATRPEALADPATVRLTALGGGLLLSWLGGRGLAFLARLPDWPIVHDLFRYGRGASARWAGAPTYERLDCEPALTGELTAAQRLVKGHALQPPRLFLGTNLWYRGARWWPSLIGTRDDAHMMTIACTGAGKSTTAIVPNLLLWDGGVVVFDPKGELAEVTALRRAGHAAADLRQRRLKGSPGAVRAGPHRVGRKVFILDPFQENRRYESAGFNPLAEIDLGASHVREDIHAIAEGAVLPEQGENIHFEESARTVIKGLIAHVLSTERPERQNLARVFELLVLGADGKPSIQSFQQLMARLAANPAGAGLCQEAAALTGRVGDREWGSILSTVQRSLSWAASPLMRQSMIRSDFQWAELRRDATIYLVLPFRHLDEHKRWLRILVNQSINTLQRVPPAQPGRPVLLVLDEFPSYGPMPKIEHSFAQMRGAGIKLWCLVQNIGQLQKLYDRNWETFLANATVQCFGVKPDDRATAEHISRALGRQVLTRREGVTLRKIKEQHDLMTPQQVSHFLAKDALRQIVFPVNAPPLKLARVNYYDYPRLFPRHLFDEACPR